MNVMSIFNNEFCDVLHSVDLSDIYSFNWPNNESIDEICFSGQNVHSGIESDQYSL